MMRSLAQSQRLGCGGGGGIRTPADRYQPGLFSRQLRSTTPAPLHEGVYRMLRRRSAEVCEVIGPVGAALDLDDFLERLPLERRESCLVVELRLGEPRRCRAKLRPRGGLSGTHLARLTTAVLGGDSGIQFVIPSIETAEANGLNLSHKWTDKIHAEKETGKWLAYVAKRPNGIPDGVLQGAPIAYWQEARSDQLLQAEIEARNGKRELEEGEVSEIAEAFGIPVHEEDELEAKNSFRVALEQKRAHDQAVISKLTARVNRSVYNQSLAERRKKKKR